MSAQEPRIGPLPAHDASDEARAVFAFWGEPGAWENGSKTVIVNTLAQHPKLAMAYNVFGKHLLLESTLTARVKELIVLRTSWRVKCQYEWHYHVGYAVMVGMTMDEIAAIRDFPNDWQWAEIDRCVLATTDDLIDRARIADETWAALSRHFDRQQIMDIVFTIGHYVMLSWALSSFGVQLEDGVDRIGYDLKTNSGAPPAARYRPGEVENWTTESGSKP